MRKLSGLAMFLALFVALTPAARATAAPALSMDALRSILVPADQEAPNSTLNTLIPLSDSGAMNEEPAGMEFTPFSCYSFNSAGLGDMQALDGWMQIGARLHETRGQVFFIQMVARVPGGPNLLAIRKAAHTCRTGTLTLEGRMIGLITYQDIRPPRLNSASAYVTRMTVQFPVPTTDEDRALLKKYHFAGGSCPADYVFVAVGDILLWSLDPDADAALQAATIMYQRARAALHPIRHTNEAPPATA